MATYGSSAIFLIIQIAAAVYCYMDMQKHSDAAFEAAGTPKQTSLILIIVGGLCCWLTLIYYYFVVRPKVEAVEQGGGYPPAV